MPGTPALPNSGRSTFPLGHINNFDAALKKAVNFTERFRFEIGIQAYLSNHRQFIGGYLNYCPRKF